MGPDAHFDREPVEQGRQKSGTITQLLQGGRWLSCRFTDSSMTAFDRPLPITDIPFSSPKQAVCSTNESRTPLATDMADKAAGNYYHLPIHQRIL